MKQETVKDIAEATPASMVSVVTLVFGVTLSEWVAIGGLVFLVLQGAYLIWRWRRDVRRDRAFERFGKSLDTE